MRAFIFIFLLLLFSCQSDTKKETTKSELSTEKSSTILSDSNSSLTVSTSEAPSEPADVTKLNYKKTAKNSEFAVYKTTAVFEGNREYYFKTLDGISLKVEAPESGETEAIIPANLLEDAKYQTGPAGANSETAGKVFEIIYDKDNRVGEIRLAEVE